MTTRTKLYASSFTSSTMLMLHVFHKPLHIPESIASVLLPGAFIPLVLIFKYTKMLKAEQSVQFHNQTQANDEAIDLNRKKRRNVFAVMGITVVGCLLSPFWLPVTGTTLGMKGDFMVGLISAAIVCLICGIQLRKI